MSIDDAVPNSIKCSWLSSLISTGDKQTPSDTIMLGSGTGSEVMQRIAGPMIGGMVTTLILTLLLIPVIFYLWQRARLKKIAKKGTFR